MEGDLESARSGIAASVACASRPEEVNRRSATFRLGRGRSLIPWKIALLRSIRCLWLKGYTHAAALPRERSAYKEPPGDLTRIAIS